MLKPTDYRIYENDSGVPTIQFGEGDIGVASVTIPDENVHGVSFCLLEESVGVGEDTGKPPSTDKEFGSFLNIISTRPEALKVIVEMLQGSIAKFYPETPNFMAQMALGDLQKMVETDQIYAERWQATMFGIAMECGCQEDQSMAISNMFMEAIFNKKAQS